jgi:crossover junction endodeoxyribonuclease RuvC
MRVLAVDPGLTRCGAAVVDGGPGRAVRFEHAQVLRTDPDDALALRLLGLEQGLQALVREYAPEAVVVERVFSQHNVASAMATASAAAVALLLGARHGLATAQHTPTEVKAAVTGNGAADKAQVSAMVCRILGVQRPPGPADITDALALGICHVWRAPLMERLAALEVRS